MSILDNLGARLRLAELPMPNQHESGDEPGAEPEVARTAIGERLGARVLGAKEVRPRGSSPAGTRHLTGTCPRCGMTQPLAEDDGYPPATHCRRCFLDPDGGYVRLVVDTDPG